ncbi:uncharacterized protein LOC131029198 isoform X2 [Cryptomeria japonica]|uniref:uncharacterized protein LOC131029198 isoform X2 n=1 Tax=Cryptomeria japonica TaxID=3369 RepID=UPI0027DA60CB|nr:uncharacterized protein LOC131029198 isoform X2 [Cryptomeria japonica]
MQRHEKIHPHTDASRVFSSMLESQSFPPSTSVEDPSRGSNRGHDPIQKFEDTDMGLELLSKPESNSVSIPINNEDSITESTEDGSYITTKSDTFSLLNENNIMTESLSTEDAKFVSKKDSEIDGFDRTTIGREAFFIDQSLEMHSTEAKNEQDMEFETTDRDVNLVEENGEQANEAEDIDSNANTWPEKSEEESLSLQVNTDLVSAIVIDKDQGNSDLGEKNSLLGQSVTVSATEQEKQSNTAEEELVLVSGQDRPQTPPVSGAAYDQMITRQELLSSGPNAIIEQSMLEQEQSCLPLLPSGEKDSLEASDQNEKQQTHIETVKLSFATNETDIVPGREVIEPVELPLATDEKSHTNEESPVMEKTDDATTEANDTVAGIGIQQYADIVESSFISNETNNMYKESSENVMLPSQIDETEGVSNECFKAVEQLFAVDVTESLVMQTDASSFETKSNVFDAEKIHADTDASCVLSSMLESESSFSFTYVEDSSRGRNGGHDPIQKLEDSDMGLELYSTAESNSVSIPTDNEDFNAESTEDGSFMTTKSDTFSLLHENNILTESQSTEDAKFVSRKDEEIDDFDRTTIGGEAHFIDQSLEMHNAESKNEKDTEREVTDRDVNLVEENGEDASEAEDIDSNTNTWLENSEEESSSLQVNTCLVSAIVIDKDQGNSNLGEENSPSVTVSATEHEKQQSNTAEEEPVLVSGEDRTQTPPENGAAYDHMITRQELPSDGPNAICEQSMLEQEQPCLPLLPLGEKDSLEGSDQNEKQQKHMETVELSFANNETESVPPREGSEPVELLLVTDEKLQTNDCDQLEESSVIEKTDDAMREATGAAAGNGIQQYLETIESSVIINETNDMCKEGSENVMLPPQIDETEGVSNECFKAVEQLSAIDETKGGLVAEAPSDEQQPNEMIEERSGIEKLPEAVRDYQGQIKSIFLNGSEELPKSISLDESNANDGPTINLHGDSTVQGGAQINGGGAKAGEPDFVDKVAAYPNDDEQQPNEMIEERSAIEKLPEAVRDYQGQIESIFLNGSEELPKSISLDESNVNDAPTISLHGGSSPTVQGCAQISGGGVKIGEPDFVDEAAAYTNDDDESSVMKNEVLAKTMSQASDQGFETLRMDRGLTENILIPEQWNEEKLQLQISEVMAKTASEMLSSSNFSEPLGATAEEQFTSSTTEIPKNSSPTSSFGTFLTHRGQESQDLQTFEVDNKASTLVREKVLNIRAEKRASIWDCCGVWNWLHAHED